MQFLKSEPCEAISTLTVVLVIFILLSITLVSCSGGETTDPVRVVERYLQAKVDGDAETIRLLLCSEMESDWQREARTFETVSDVAMQDVVCQRRGAENVVVCQGKIVANYGAEQSEFPLGAYLVVYEGGDWKWCGETR
jgi:hypothetical protein